MTVRLNSGGADLAVLDPLHRHRSTLVDRDTTLRMLYLERAIEIAADLHTH
ncbi:hypothetical protein [Promicromonospora soli]